jgi:hypothetical protein
MAFAQYRGLGEERVHRTALRELELASLVEDNDLAEDLRRSAEYRLWRMLDTREAQREARSALIWAIATTVVGVVVTTVVLADATGSNVGRWFWTASAGVYLVVAPTSWLYYRRARRSLAAARRLDRVGHRLDALGAD